MTAHERAEAFVKRYPSQTWIDKKFMVAALEIEFLEADADPETNQFYNEHYASEKPLAQRTFDLGTYGE